MGEDSQLLAQVLVAVISAILASSLTAWYSRRLFYSQKWWEKKADVYSKILESLHYMKQAYAEDLDADLDGKEIPNDRKQELQKRYSDGLDDLNKQIDIWQFVLSEKTMPTIQRMHRARDSYTGIEWYGYLHTNYRAIDDAMNAIRALAKAELKRG